MATAQHEGNVAPSRPRRPDTIPFDLLPDPALVDKSVRRAVTGLGDSEAYARIAEGRFPAPVRLGPRCSRWRVGDLRAWLDDPTGWRASGEQERAK